MSLLIALILQKKITKKKKKIKKGFILFQITKNKNLFTVFSIASKMGNFF